MADLTFGINGQNLDMTVTATIADTDAPRILAYLTGLYGTDAEGKPRTTAQAVDAFAKGILQGLLNETVAFEREAAARAAAQSVTDIARL